MDYRFKYFLQQNLHTVIYFFVKMQLKCNKNGVIHIRNQIITIKKTF